MTGMCRLPMKCWANQITHLLMNIFSRLRRLQAAHCSSSSHRSCQ